MELVLLLFLLSSPVICEVYLEDALTSEDKIRLKGLFESSSIADFEAAYHVAGGLSLLGANENKAEQEICQFLKNNQDISNVHDIYYATSAATYLKSCSFKAIYQKLYEKTLKSYINDSANVSTVSSVVISLSNIGIKVDYNILSAEKLTQLAIEQEQPLLYGEAFRAAGHIVDGDKNGLLDVVEDVVAQADETVSTAYFDGGVITTSIIVSGIFELAASTNTSPLLTAAQASKFGNYLICSKYTLSLKEAYYLLVAMEALGNNKFIVPVSVTLANFKAINFQNSDLKVNVQNILGEHVLPYSLMLTTMQSASGRKETHDKLFSIEKNRITYSVPLYVDSLAPGSYIVTLSSKPQVAPLNNVQLVIPVSYSIAIESAELFILEKEQNIVTKSVLLQYPQRFLEEIVADCHSKVKMTFSLYNKQSKLKVTAHQTFVRLVSTEGEEIFFVATSTDDIYNFELDVRTTAEEFFGQKSGAYEMSIIVGDSFLENPFSWTFGTLILKFQQVPTPSLFDAGYMYKPMPEIKHVFQQPEKRPPGFVSASFSGLILVPLVSLLIVWLVLGANVSNIWVSSPWSIIFHVGLIGISALYYCFWIQLNMFATLKYLLLLGLITFIAGNNMLRIIAKVK